MRGELKRIQSTITRADGRRNSTRRWRTLYDTFNAEVEKLGGPITEATTQIIQSLATTSVILEELGRRAALGDLPNGDEHSRLVNLQRRLLRQLRLIPDVREATRRRSQSEKIAEEMLAADPAPDPMVNYIQQRKERTARLARRIGVDVELLDPDRGRLNEDEARHAWKTGDAKKLRRLIAEAKAAMASMTDTDATPPPPPKRARGSIKRVSL